MTIATGSTCSSRRVFWPRPHRAIPARPRGASRNWKEFPILAFTPEARLLVRHFLGNGLIPERFAEDAAHVAIATVHGMDFLLTWNCRHIVNAEIMRRLIAVAAAEGYALTGALHAGAINGRVRSCWILSWKKSGKSGTNTLRGSTTTWTRSSTISKEIRRNSAGRWSRCLQTGSTRPAPACDRPGGRAA